MEEKEAAIEKDKISGQKDHIKPKTEKSRQESDIASSSTDKSESKIRFEKKMSKSETAKADSVKDPAVNDPQEKLEPKEIVKQKDEKDDEDPDDNTEDNSKDTKDAEKEEDAEDKDEVSDASEQPADEDQEASKSA